MDTKANTGWKIGGLRLVVLALLLLAWESSVRLGLVDAFYVSTPGKVAARVLEWVIAGDLWRHLGYTLLEAGVGFAAGLLLGVAGGLFFATFPLVDRVFQPFVNVVNAMPRIAIAPLLVLWFGFGLTSKAILVVSLVFFVVFANVYQGFKDVRPAILKNARVLGASRGQLLRHIYLPATMMWTFACLRVCVGFSLIGAILGEYVASNAGIGFLIDNAQANFDATGVMAGIAVITMAVLLLDYLIGKIERRVLAWKDPTSARTTPAMT